MDQPPSVPLPTWLSRHWRWFVPAISLAGVLVVLGFITVIISVMRQSDVYQLAVARAKASPEVTAVLGVPVKEGFFLKGNIHVSTQTGQAQLEIPLEGPKAYATVYVEATKTQGVWHFDQLVVIVEPLGPRIDLRR